MQEQTIATKLEANTDAIRMLRTGGAVGRAVAAGLAARYGLDPAAPLGHQLVACGLLTPDEAAWLDGPSAGPAPREH
jgi:hypothetical protein